MPVVVSDCKSLKISNSRDSNGSDLEMTIFRFLSLEVLNSKRRKPQLIVNHKLNLLRKTEFDPMGIDLERQNFKRF